MTDSTTTTRVSYTGDGTSVNFTITFPFYLSTDILVQLAGATVTSGYSISGGGGSTGILIMATAPAAGVNVQAILNPPLTQIVNLVDGTAFPSATLNQVNDRSVQIALRLQDQISRSIRAPDGDSAPVMLLPTAANRKNQALMFDPSGNLTLGVPNTQVITTSLLAPFLGLQQTAAEIAIGVMPVNFAYAPGHAYRYGTNTVPGTTDMTAAIQAALNQSGQTGGAAAFLPVGIHKTTATLNLSQYARFYGEGFSSQINYSGSGVALLATATAVTAWRRAMVQRLYVNNIGTGTDGIQVNNIAEFEITESVFQGFSNAGIHLTGTLGQACINIWAHHNVCVSNTGHGLLIDGVNNLNQITIHSNRLQGNTGYGLKVAVAGKGLSIVGNDIEGNQAGQLYLSGGNVAGVDVSGNYFESTVNQPSILLSDTQAAFGVSIRGNYLQTDIATTNVIFIGNSGAGASGVEISGNSFLGTYTTAINANIAQNSRFGPNYTPNGTHVVSSASNTGIEIQDAVGVRLNASRSSLRVFPAYGSTINIDLSLSENQSIQATNSTAFTIANPTNQRDGLIVNIMIINATGAPLGTITWGSAYHLAGGAFTAPGASSQRAVTFQSDGTILHELYRTSADVA